VRATSRSKAISTTSEMSECRITARAASARASRDQAALQLADALGGFLEFSQAGTLSAERQKRGRAAL
jgi:hypothetical protein